MASHAPRVLVHEYFSGGGWPQEDFPQGISQEGLAMLKAVLAEFAAWGFAKVVTTFDSRLPQEGLKASEIITLHHQEYPDNLAKALEKADAALIIAPEDDGILTRLSRLVLAQGKILLGSRPQATALCSDKWQTQRLFLKHGLSVPQARLTDRAHAGKAARALGYPLVVKPRGASDCSGMSLVQSESDLIPALVRAGIDGESVILQRYIRGQAASVSVLAAPVGAKALSLNLQHLKISDGFEYLGGVANVGHPLRHKAFDLALQAVSLVPGLMGYCGVDMVLSGEHAWLVEINPRLTTSFVGLAQTTGPNLAQAIWQACTKGELPPQAEFCGEVRFGKERTNE